MKKKKEKKTYYDQLELCSNAMQYVQDVLCSV